MTDTPPGALPLPVVPGLTDLAVFARGGYATVYRATQQSVGREVAVKVENRTLDSERDQQRFLREARAAGRMSSHPHVVDLFDAGVTADQHPYLIMELCDGSYAERMRNSPLNAVEARDLGIKIADAIAHAHAAGVLHRDIKPANILHSHFNPAVLADFGLAVLAEVRDHTVTLEVLTPAYAPPEMFRHSPPSPAVDVYALCATLYAVMDGKPPRWQADRNPSLITLMELFHQPIPDLPGIPPALLDILRSGMANNPADRPTAEQLRDLLTAVSPYAPGTVAPTSGAPISGVPISGGPASGMPTWGGVNGALGFPVDAESTQTVVTAPHPLPRQAGPVSPGWAPSRPPYQTDPPTLAVPPGSGAGRPNRRQLQWFIGGVATLALLASVGIGSWLANREPAPQPSTTGGPPATATGGAPTGLSTPSTAIGGALPGCLQSFPGGARCTPELECFGPVRIRRGSAAAVPVRCAGRHTWETYVVGELPSEVDAADHAAVKADPTVRQVCAETTFRLAAGLMSVVGWRFEVLPPSEEAVDGGDRVFRCLAGRGVDGLTGPTLAR